MRSAVSAGVCHFDAPFPSFWNGEDLNGELFDENRLMRRGIGRAGRVYAIARRLKLRAWER